MPQFHVAGRRQLVSVILQFINECRMVRYSNVPLLHRNDEMVDQFLLAHIRELVPFSLHAVAFQLLEQLIVAGGVDQDLSAIEPVTVAFTIGA